MASSRSGSFASLLPLVVLWAIFSTAADSLNKAILTRFAHPISLTLAQFGVSSLLGHVALRRLALHPHQDGHALVGWRRIWPVTLCQALGFLSTNLALGLSAVSFTQAVKAAAPLFSLALSVAVLGQSFPPAVYLSLVPIVGGVALTAVTELRFDALGFAAALVSNLCFTSRSVLAKGAMQRMDGINLYAYLCTTAAAVVLPLWLATDALVFARALAPGGPGFASLLTDEGAAAGTDAAWVLSALAAMGAFHFAYNQVSFLVLARVVPLTHAVCNVLRRICIVAFTIVYFGRNPPVSNLAGIATVFGGVLLYLTVKSGAGVKAAPERRKEE